MNNIAMNGISNIGLIVWKKVDDIYKCHITNRNVNVNTSLDEYIDTNDKENEAVYRKLIATKTHQMIKKNHSKILLQYVNDDTIFQIHMPNDESLYFMSCISHKIRNPLTNIMGTLSLLDNLKLDKTQQKYVNILKKSSTDIIEIANDIVDILNLNHVDMKLNFEKVNIRKMLQDCKNIVFGNFDEKKLEMKISIDRDVPTSIITDYQRLRQIIFNILKNAYYYTTIGYISVEVSIFNSSDSVNFANPFVYTEAKLPTYNILFKIKDTGIGIDNSTKKFVEKILGINDDFNYEMTKYTGFGLLISRWLCYLFGGNIWFKSEVDMGSIFYFNILCDGFAL